MSWFRSLYNTIIEYFHFIVVFILLIAFYPYEFYSAYMIDLTGSMAQIFELSIILLLVLCSIFRKHKLNIPNYLYAVIVMQFLGLVFTNIAKGESVPIGQMLLKFTALMMVVYLSATCGLISFFKKYNRWIFLMALGGAISLVLMWAGMLEPLYPFIDLADESTMYNYGITFAQYTDVSVYRPAGFFDEPGALASWGMFAILLNRAFVKDGKIEILIIACLFATISFGFFLQLAVFVTLFMLTGVKSKKLIRNILFIVIGLAVVITTLSGLKGTKYDSIYEKTIGRFENISQERKTQGGGALSVDNRKEYTEAALKEFYENPLFGTKKKNIEVGNNVYEPLALYGIIGTFFLYFPFIFLFFKAIKDKDSVMIKCMIVMFLGFLHRPFHNNLLSHFIIYSFLALYYQQRLLDKKPSMK